LDGLEGFIALAHLLWLSSCEASLIWNKTKPFWKYYPWLQGFAQIAKHTCAACNHQDVMHQKAIGMSQRFGDAPWPDMWL